MIIMIMIIIMTINRNSTKKYPNLASFAAWPTPSLEFAIGTSVSDTSRHLVLCHSVLIQSWVFSAFFGHIKLF